MRGLCPRGGTSIPEKPEGSDPGETGRRWAGLAKPWPCGPSQADGMARGWPGPSAVGREHGSGAPRHVETAGPERRTGVGKKIGNRLQIQFKVCRLCSGEVC